MRRFDSARCVKDMAKNLMNFTCFAPDRIATLRLLWPPKPVSAIPASGFRSFLSPWPDEKMGRGPGERRRDYEEDPTGAPVSPRWLDGRSRCRDQCGLGDRRPAGADDREEKGGRDEPRSHPPPPPRRIDRANRLPDMRRPRSSKPRRRGSNRRSSSLPSLLLPRAETLRGRRNKRDFVARGAPFRDADNLLSVNCAPAQRAFPLYRE